MVPGAHPRGGRKTVLTFLQAVFPLEIVITEESILPSRQPNQQRGELQDSIQSSLKRKERGESQADAPFQEGKPKTYSNNRKQKPSPHPEHYREERPGKRRPKTRTGVSCSLTCTISHLGQQLPKIWRDETQNKLSDSYSKLSLLMLKLPAKNYGV